LHANYPSNQQSLAGKRGQRLEFASPEKYPSLKNKFTESLNYEGDVVKSCIHCHQIGDARREYYWTAGKPIPEELMFPYPHPKSIGLILNPDEEATVASIEPNSAAAQSGLRAGDVIKTFAGQPMLSIADVQWVLHRIKASGGGTTLEVVREGKPIELKLTLEEGWRRAGDITWRVSTWPLRRMVLGGMVLDQLSDEQREQLRSSRSSAALAVKRVGQYGAHAAAKKAGFREGDLLVEFDGRSDFASETDLLRYAIANRRAGDTVDVTVLRRGQSKKLKLPIQQ
jgi:serine protease Do